MNISFESFFQNFVCPFVEAHNGFAAPNYQKAASNLSNTPDENRRYLGTYFPRTALETLSIFDHVFSSEKVAKTVLGHKQTLRVIDFGCGTGGEAIGFLGALRMACPKAIPAVDISIVDGNADALQIALQAVNGFAEFAGMNVTVRAYHGALESSDTDFCSGFQGFQGEFDIVLTSKFLNEMNDCFKEPYLHFAEAYLPRLSQTGIAVILDVTCQQSAARGGQWANLQMTAELDAFLKDNQEFRTLFPLVCSACRKPACDQFPQLVFDFSPIGYCVKPTKLTCRVICRENLWQAVRADAKPAVYFLTCWGKDKEDRYCVEPGALGRIASLPKYCMNKHA